MSTYVADIRLGEHDSFFTPERATAAEAFADAMRLVGCTTAFDAFIKLGMASGYDRWWQLPVTAFNVFRLGEDGEIDDTFHGVFGRYKCADDSPTCERCGDAVEHLSTDGYCDSCVAHNEARVVL